MPRQELRHPVLVFFHQEAAGRIEQPPAGLHIGRGCREDFALVTDPLLELRRLDPPFRIRPPPPGARAGARRVHENEVHLPDQRLKARALARMHQLHIMRPGAFQARDQRRQAFAVNVIGVDLTRALHLRGERQRLATAPGAIVQNLLARFRICRRRRNLAAGVLHLDPALGKSWNPFDAVLTLGRVARGDMIGVGQ